MRISAGLVAFALQLAAVAGPKVIAVNLDGGGSTGILVANPREIISPDRPLPFVLLVYHR